MKTVLVIEDEEQIRRLLRVSLEQHGFSVVEAASAAHGLQLAREVKPDVVLLDLGLPDRDGADALAELRTQSAVPIIILSVRNTEEEIVKLLESGADDYLIKPFNTGELVARMKAIIRNKMPGEPNRPFVSGRLTIDLVAVDSLASAETRHACDAHAQDAPSPDFSRELSTQHTLSSAKGPT